MKKLNPNLLQSDVVIGIALPEYDADVASVIDPDWLAIGYAIAPFATSDLYPHCLVTDHNDVHVRCGRCSPHGYTISPRYPFKLHLHRCLCYGYYIGYATTIIVVFNCSIGKNVIKRYRESKHAFRWLSPLSTSQL